MSLTPLSSARKYDNSRAELQNANKHRTLDLRGLLRRKFYVNSALVKPAENSVCSPLAALMPLAKLALGAEGDSLKELLNAIGLSERNKIKDEFKYRIKEMREILGARLQVASKFYIAMDNHLKSSYRDLVTQTFKTNIQRVNFRKPVQTVKAINSWVAGNTGGKINNIVHESDISSDTQMLIVNAIRLKAKWKIPFEKDNITFHTPRNGIKTVRAMKVINHYNYIDEAVLKAKIIKVPYEGGKLDLMIIAPDYLSDLHTLLKELKSKPELLEAAMSRMTNKSIELLIPTFKIETDINLKRMYQELGVKHIFNGVSGLDRIVTYKPISVSKAKQRTILNVCDQGTEAGAATDCFIVMCLSELSTARKKHMRTENYNSSEILVKPKRIIDFRGSLRTECFANCALMDPTKNFVHSPLSALLPLANLALGAVGNCLKELLQAIGLSDKNKIKRHFQRLIAEMRYLPGARLCIASKFYIASDYHLKTSYRHVVEEIFKANIQSVIFHAPAETANVINSWVSKYTGDRIKNIVQGSEISPDTQLFLVNAIHFRAKWKTPFQTDNVTFHTIQGAVKTVPGMKVTGIFNYTDDAFLKAKLIKVPYEGEKAYFLIILPNYLNDLIKLLNDLKKTPYMLDSALSRLDSQELELFMPTFSITTEIDMREMYQKVGLKEIFETNSGLDEMVKEKTITLSKGKQKTFISVYELGTEASKGAVSVVNVTKSGCVRMPIFVDRPFLFFILAENQQLLSGIVTDPSK